MNYARKSRGDYTPIDSPSKTNPMNIPLSGNIVGSKEIHIATAQLDAGLGHVSGIQVKRVSVLS